MGVLADLLANASTIDTSAPRVGIDRAFVRKINDALARRAGNDPAYPTGLDSAANEVQTVSQFGGTPSAGTFTLAFTLFGGVTFTTAAIAYDADAATIEAAIDAVADPKVPGFTAGDIAVTDGPLDGNDLTLTFSGASVASKNHGLTVIEVTGLTGGTVGPVAQATAGKPIRRALAALYALGIFSGSPPAHGVNTFTAAISRGNFPLGLDEPTVRLLAEEAEKEEGTSGMAAAILTALGYT